jgi:hypothetical protein
LNPAGVALLLKAWRADRDDEVRRMIRAAAHGFFAARGGEATR